MRLRGTKDARRGVSRSLANKGIVPAGVGFGGAATAKALKHADADVTLIASTDCHLFPPLFGGGARLMRGELRLRVWMTTLPARRVTLNFGT
jgi:NADH dehydrogenase FAD-containing subunit